MSKHSPSDIKYILDSIKLGYELSENKKEKLINLLEDYLNHEIVPVIRCRDCVNKYICGKGKDYFCSYGEKVR